MTSRRDRYKNDPEYRERVLEQNKTYRRKKIEERPAAPPKEVKRERRPIMIQVELFGKKVNEQMFYVSSLAKILGRAPSSIYQWERMGVLPRTPFFIQKKKRERLYTGRMMHVVAGAIDDRDGEVPMSDNSFAEQIIAGWIESGVKL